jgi:hypothetical protein
MVSLPVVMCSELMRMSLRFPKKYAMGCKPSVSPRQLDKLAQLMRESELTLEPRMLSRFSRDRSREQLGSDGVKTDGESLFRIVDRLTGRGRRPNSLTSWLGST